jgi:hypothetical protein
MYTEKREVTMNKQGKLIDCNGNVLTPPSDWSFLPAGDAGITRKITAKGIFWRVTFKKGRRTMSKGIWAPADAIKQAQKHVETVRSTEAYQKKKAYTIQRRDKQQQEYEVLFCTEVEKFLNFHPSYQVISKTLSILITRHAIPIGSGTVARTSMIPIEERASKAVIAWMRHHTTAYDNMQIARIKGERRAVRRILAEQSINVLKRYRDGLAIPVSCPLKSALEKQIKN